MVIISNREFRTNSKKYFDLALKDEVVIKSRNYGSYKLVPVEEEFAPIKEPATLQAKIAKGIAEYEKGEAIPMNQGETMDAFLNRLISTECPTK